MLSNTEWACVNDSRSFEESPTQLSWMLKSILLQHFPSIDALATFRGILRALQMQLVRKYLKSESRITPSKLFTLISEFSTCKIFLLFVVFFLLPHAPVSAQQVPDSVAPGQIERQFQPIPIPRQPGAPIVPGQRDLVSPDGASDVVFKLNDLQLEGVTVFEEAEITQVFSSLIGTDITLLDLYKIANDITALYRNKGFILSQAVVPEQEIREDGVVTIRVIEGYIEGLKINDADPKTKNKLESYGNKILDSKPLHSSDLERYMLLMNDLGGVTARATLASSETTFGAAQLVIQVQRDNFSAFINPNNRGSDFFGPGQITGNVSSHNIGNALGTSSVFGASTLNNELNFLSLSHVQPVGGEGLTLSLNVSGSESEPGGSLKELEIEQETLNAGITARYPIIRSRFKNLEVHGSFAIHDSDSERTEVDDTSFNLIRAQTEDKVRSIRAGVTFDKADRMGGINQIIVEASKGLDIFDATELGTTASRPLGDPEYTKFNLAAARVQSLGKGWSLLSAVAGQFTNDDLLSSEQFSVGGPLFGRGHDQSEIVGDSGYAGQLELRYARNSKKSWLNEYVAYAFVDGGETERETPGDLEEDESLSSAGLGVRFRIRDKFRGYIELADPISHVVASEGDEDPRVFISVQWDG